MIIKSMSRKHPSFAQLIDYIERESKLKSRNYSIHHNTYSRNSEALKREFEENSKYLQARKNGVYLYHEVVSITRSQHLAKDEQKDILKRITESYIQARGKNNLAYAVLHEDTDNFHFHIVLSSNEVGTSTRKRLSKEQFSEIQTQLEAWVLREYPQLEQQAVFHKNQTEAERADREAKKSHLSNNGEQLKRRGGRTSIRDDVQERLADIFSNARDPRHFADLMQEAGFTLYTRGQSHGVTDRDGNKYRLNRLGLAEAWQTLDARMSHVMKEAQEKVSQMQGKDTQQEPKNRHGHEATATPQQATDPASLHTEYDPITAEAEKRLAEIKAHRAKQATTEQQARHTDHER